MAKSIHAMEELIRHDCETLRSLTKEIKQLHFFDDPDHFLKAKKLWTQAQSIVKRLEQLEYKEEHLLPIVERKLLKFFEKAKKELHEL